MGSSSSSRVCKPAIRRPSTIASMLSGAAAAAASGGWGTAGGVSLIDGVSVALGDLSCRWRPLSLGAEGDASDSSSDDSSDDSESDADLTGLLEEAYRQL